MKVTENTQKTYTKAGLTKKEILHDYYIAQVSRYLSLFGRKEVMTGKAKFGIFGDGKELAQVAMARYFENGDWRSGYYRDQTFLLAAGLTNTEEFFYQLYGDIRLENNPHSGGRNFNNHFATRSLNPDGTWKDLTQQKNTTADISPTAGQMPRMLGLGLASKLYKHHKIFQGAKGISKNGREVVFGTIGDASTSEGHFFEVMNAAGVLQVPITVSVWDDGYGISVAKDKQSIKSSISETLKGFEKVDGSNGIRIFKARGWDYPALAETYQKGIQHCRETHTPVLFHIEEMTQPQGHSTSGSHERYKSAERLKWESDHDPIKKMREWLLKEGIALPEELEKIEAKALSEVKTARDKVWKSYSSFIRKEKDQLIAILSQKECQCNEQNEARIDAILHALNKLNYPIRKDIVSTAKKIIRYICHDCVKNKELKGKLLEWLHNNYFEHIENYSDSLYNETTFSVLNIKGNQPIYSDHSPTVNGREILNENFDHLLGKHPMMVAFGEDLGQIGGVNQCFEGLQAKHGEHRVFDTGIRETSIIGKGIGLALRGFRPIAEIQYFDYLLYAIQTLSDDLASLHWRTRAGQVAPLIIRTRGHRLEGIWHAGSPISMVLGALRGIYFCTPRNMTQAAGMYNTLMEGQDPALIVEPLNAYRYKEVRPDNLTSYKVALGMPEILTEGTDITIVTYGSCVRIAQEAVQQLKEFNIDCELIDVQTLLPFDIHHVIKDSVKKTGKVMFFDEDVPGGGTAYMMQKVLDVQKAFSLLTYPPVTLAAKEHRPAYGSDGDYFSKPSAENIFEKVYSIFNEIKPDVYPSIISF
jgi:2-oxoisovalerate dehydrogenase E1 component